MKTPYILVRPKEWFGDVLLRSCSPGARGLLIDLICIMHEWCVPYGHLALNGKPLNDIQVSHLIGIDVDEYRKLLKELLDKGIIKKTADGILYSEKLMMDYNLREKRKLCGTKGGNPNLVNFKVNLINTYFKNITIDEYIELLNAKLPMPDWTVIFAEVVKAYPNTQYLELAVQHLLVWLYNSKRKFLGKPIAILKKLIQDAEDGYIPPSTLNKEQLKEALKPNQTVNSKILDILETWVKKEGDGNCDKE